MMDVTDAARRHDAFLINRTRRTVFQSTANATNTAAGVLFFAKNCSNIQFEMDAYTLGSI